MAMTIQILGYVFHRFPTSSVIPQTQELSKSPVINSKVLLNAGAISKLGFTF